MKHVWMLVALLMLAPAVYADEVVDAAALNRPHETVDTAKRAIDALEPGVDTLYDFNDGEWRSGASVGLWNFTSNEVAVASLRAGYASEYTLYGAVRLDLPGLTRRFVPSQVKGIATAGPLHLLWSTAGKYASVGPFVGYDFAGEDIRYGVSVGAAFQF